MKKQLMIVALLCATGHLGAIGQDPIRQVRADAVNGLARNLPCKFIDQKTLLDALDFIDQKLDAKTHQELLKLQAEADSLQQQRAAMMAIPGIDENHPAVKYIDGELVGVEKRLDDLLYNGGFFHWKTMTALGAGAVAGALTYCDKNPLFVKSNWTTTLLTGFGVAILLEWSIRGRRAVLAGNFATLAKFIGSVATKFCHSVFGDGGYADRMIASVERALRSAGKKLDSVLHNPWIAGGIGVVGAAIAGGIIYKLGHDAGKKKGEAEGAKGAAAATSTAGV